MVRSSVVERDHQGCIAAECFQPTVGVADLSSMDIGDDERRRKDPFPWARHSAYDYHRQLFPMTWAVACELALLAVVTVTISTEDLCCTYTCSPNSGPAFFRWSW
jgi:hypothetical protein